MSVPSAAAAAVVRLIWQTANPTADRRQTQSARSLIQAIVSALKWAASRRPIETKNVRFPNETARAVVCGSDRNGNININSSLKSGQELT